MLGNQVLDFGLNALINQADQLVVCSQQPTTFTEAASTYKMGSKVGTSGGGGLFTGPANAAPDGRQVTTVAFVDGLITATGTVAAWAVLDQTHTLLLATGLLTVGTPVTSGMAFSFGSLGIALAAKMFSFAATSLTTSSPALGSPVMSSAGQAPVLTGQNFTLAPGYGLDAFVGTVGGSNAPTSYVIDPTTDPNTYFKCWPSGNLRTTDVGTAPPPGTYSLRIAGVNVAGQGAWATFSVNCQAAAPVINTPINVSVALPISAPGPVGSPLTASNVPTSWAITHNAGSDPQTNFAIDNNGQLSTTANAIANLTTAGTQSITVTASNLGGTGTATATITLLAPSGYADGMSTAPFRSTGPQYPTILNNYHVAGAQAGRNRSSSYQPPWNVAGVDYPVGCPTNITLKDPSVQANLPTGATANAGSKVVSITGANITLDGYQFPTDWTVNVAAGASGVATITRCKFNIASNAIPHAIVQSTSASITLVVTYCEFNGGSPDTCSNPDIFATIAPGNGASKIWYNWFYGQPIDCIGYGTCNNSADIRYNLFSGWGYSQPSAQGGHPDSVQQYGMSTSDYLFAFNTLYADAGSFAHSGNEAMMIQADNSGVMSNCRQLNNTILAVAGFARYSILVGIFGDSSLDGVSTNNNYMDPTSSAYGPGADACWPATSMPYFGSHLSFVGNMCMTTGAATRPAQPSGSPYIYSDVINTTANPASGNLAVGQSVTFTLTFNQAVNVSGSPKLNLSNGKTANYSSGSGTKALNFTYTVAAGDTGSNLAITGVTVT